jgi:hypothetical protein
VKCAPAGRQRCCSGVAFLKQLLRVGSLLVATVLLVSGGVRAGASEAQAKAALLYNLLAFVEWPPGAGEEKTFVIGVAGDDDVLDALKPLAGQIVKRHAVVVREVRDEDDPTICHVLYLAAARDGTAASMLRRVGSAPVLTVGDGSDFAKQGGIVFVAFDNSRLRFDVSLTNANKAQLKISSKVLGMARTVTSDGPPR